MNEEIPKKENTPELTFSATEKFEHDIRNRLTAVLMSHAVFEAYKEVPTAGDPVKAEEDIKKMWGLLFQTVEDFLSGKFGKMDEPLRSSIGKLMEFKDRNPLEKDSVTAVSDLLGKTFSPMMGEIKEGEGK